jgi:hypothetical protein
MKQKLIAAALALAYAAGCSANQLADDVQSTLQTSNDPTQTTRSSDRTKQSPNNVPGGAVGQQSPWAYSWPQLGEGWKQFGDAGKAEENKGN